jgi:hypothetical protein
VGDYLPTHYVAPNRYVVPALPGLAVLGGFGLAWLAGTVARQGTARTTVAGGSAPPEAARATVVEAPARRGAARTAVAVALALVVAVPGTARYLAAAAGSVHLLERDQRTLAAALPLRAVVFGAYAPTLLFDTRARLISTWPPAGANVDDPVGRFGVSHVLAAGPADPADPTTQVPAFRALDGRRPLARVEWGGRTVSLYEVGAATATR